MYKIVSGKLLYSTASLAQYSDDLEGWNGRELRLKMEGTYLYIWLYHVFVQQKVITL